MTMQLELKQRAKQFKKGEPDRDLLLAASCLIDEILDDCRRVKSSLSEEDAEYWRTEISHLEFARDRAEGHEYYQMLALRKKIVKGFNENSNT